MKRLTIAIGLLTASLLLISCGDNVSGNEDEDNMETGAIAVQTSTSGNDQDSDGYTFEVEGTSKNAGANGTIYFTGLQQGNHELALDTSSVAGNCEAGGSATRNISVFAGDTTTSQFNMSCAQVANNMIAFSGGRDGDLEIFLMNADGSNPTKLTDNTVEDTNVEISNDGTQLAFISARSGGSRDQLYIMNVDGTDVQQVTTSPAQPSYVDWSPDDSRLVYHGFDNDDEIFIIDADGNNLTRLTDNTGTNDNYPDWSPDGDKIVFASDRGGTTEIYTMDPDGSNIQQITNNGGTVPNWSPDGSKIAFQSTRSGNSELYIMNGDGTGLRRLTNDGDFDCCPSWSPDGSEIAFETSRDGNLEIYKMNADGSGSLINLTVDPDADFVPSWSPVE